MRAHHWRFLWLALLLFRGAAFPDVIPAQEGILRPQESIPRPLESVFREREGILPPIQEGFFLTPSFGVSELFTDNINASPSHRLHDWVTRFSPGLEAGYDSGRFTGIAGYNFDSEIFARHSEFNSAMARQRGILDFRYLPAPPLTLFLKGEYLETESPGELNVVTGFPNRRERAQRFAVDPSATYRFSPLTTGTLGYTFSQDKRESGVTTDTQIGRTVIDHRITTRDSVGLDYTFTQYLFKGTEEFIISRGAEVLARVTIFEGRDTVQVHSIQPSWTRDLTPLTSFSVRAGPRFSEGSVKPEISAAIRRRLKQGEVILVYGKSHATVVGEAGIVDTNGVTLAARYNVLPTLELSAAPAYYRNKRGGVKSDVYRFRFDAAYALNRWLSLVGTYLLVHQRGLFLPPEVFAFPEELAAAGIRSDAKITTNTVGLSLVAKFRTKLD